MDVTYTLDVLTDGSEDTGQGTLFLSVWRNKCENLSVEDLHSAPTVRYAVTGLGDATSRLSADQKFKLNVVKALFVSDSTGIQGLPSLVIALRAAGAPELTVVSSIAARVEQLMDVVFPHHRANPVLKVCNVPDQTKVWWTVYEDDYLRVHAMRADDSAILYIYSLLAAPNRPSLVILPRSFDRSQVHMLIMDLPLHEDETPTSLRWGVCMGTEMINCSPQPEWWYTQPQKRKVDPGLLVRAQCRSRVWHTMLADLYPWNHELLDTDRVQRKTWLRSGMSLILSETEPRLINRSESLAHDFCDDFPFSSNFLATADVSRSQSFDENEIDIEEDDCLAREEMVKLLVLGTGCASPSPYRGASGYALLLSDDLSIAFEVGEGFVLQWYRHAMGRPLTTIRTIWISHAHWDHYGGLYNLLVCINQRRLHNGVKSGEYVHKRPKLQSIDPPTVIATSKILRYLKLMFDEPESYFRPMLHSNAQKGIPYVDQASRKNPIASWENVRVDHSCCAYGFIVNIERFQDTPFIFCFSGDTRPCKQLVERCQRAAKTHKKNSIDFLLHEATFDESEKVMSASKKHSTIQEALEVADDVNATRTLLTHFSQRYHTCVGAQEGSQHKIGFAVDGLLVNLTAINK